MAAKVSGYQVKLAGPGITFDRPISEEIANQIINLVMAGATGHQSSGGAGKGAAAGVGNAGLGLPGGSVGAGQGHFGGVTIKQFVSQKRPKNMYQRVACLAYYLTHAVETPHFKTKDISKANTDAAVSKLTNASVFVNDATSKYHYLSQAPGGAKQITVLGEQLVEALPDYDKVKQVLADGRPRKKKARRKQKKS
jgi:uncharacterized protein YcfJ